MTKIITKLFNAYYDPIFLQKYIKTKPDQTINPTSKDFLEQIINQKVN